MSDTFWLTASSCGGWSHSLPKSRAGAGGPPARAEQDHLREPQGPAPSDAPGAYGRAKARAKTLDHRRSRTRVLARMMPDLAQGEPDTDVVMIDAAHLEAHRTAWSLRARKADQARGVDA